MADTVGEVMAAQRLGLLSRPVPRDQSYEYGSVLPFRKPKAGGPAEWGFMYSDLVKGLLDAFSAPNRAYMGQEMRPDDAMNVAMAAMGVGAAAGSAPTGSLGMNVKAKPAGGGAFDSVVSKWRKAGVKLDVTTPRNGRATLSRIVVPDDMRGSGVGSSVMRELAKAADDAGTTITLSPSTDFGGSSVSRLQKFYKKFGFVDNKGRTRDFEISEAMYRMPKGGD